MAVVFYCPLLGVGELFANDPVAAIAIRVAAAQCHCHNAFS